MQSKRTYQNLSTGENTVRKHVAAGWKRAGERVSVAIDRRLRNLQRRQNRRLGVAH